MSIFANFSYVIAFRSDNYDIVRYCKPNMNRCKANICNKILPITVKDPNKNAAAPAMIKCVSEKT